MRYEIQNKQGTAEEIQAFAEFLLLKLDQQQEEASPPVFSEFTMKAVEKRAEVLIERETEKDVLLKDMAYSLQESCHIMTQLLGGRL